MAEAFLRGLKMKTIMIKCQLGSVKGHLRFSRTWRAIANCVAVTHMLIVMVALPANSKVIEVSPLDFPRLIGKQKKPVYASFYSPECGHCRAMDSELDILAEEMKGQVLVVKVDARGAHNTLNSYSALIRFKELGTYSNGKEVPYTRETLQGLRQAVHIKRYLEKYLRDDLIPVNHLETISSIIDNSTTPSFLGLFSNTEEKEFHIFEKIAQKMKAEALFLYASDPNTTERIMEKYRVTTLPALLVLKTAKHVEVYSGSLENTNGVEKWVDERSFPIIGNFSVLTYKKYTTRSKPAAFLFYDEKLLQDGVDRLSEVKSQLLPFAAEHHHKFSFATIDKGAVIDGMFIASMSGLTWFNIPAFAFKTIDARRALAYNQLEPLSEAGLHQLLTEWNEGWVMPRCMIKPTQFVEPPYYSDETLEAYQTFANYIVDTYNLTDSEIPLVDSGTADKLIKNTWEDVLIVYVARWCYFSNLMEYRLHDLIRRGVFEPIEYEFRIVKVTQQVDVVLSSMVNFKQVKTVPGMKFISARYPTFPHWYAGRDFELEDIVEFVNNYHSMRYVEIPGEPKSRFADRSNNPRFKSRRKPIEEWFAEDETDYFKDEL